MTIAGDVVKVTITVPVPPAAAFHAFTAETDLWWGRSPRYRVAGRQPGQIAFEPRLGGRLFEQYDGPAGPRVHEAGTITAWDPPGHLAFAWRGANFSPSDVTHVDIRFTATATGTRVDLAHSGFASLRADHPVRHGEDVAAFIGRMGMWWATLLRSLRDHATAG